MNTAFRCPNCNRLIRAPSDKALTRVNRPHPKCGLEFRAARRATSSRAVDDLVQAMIQALSLRKIGFFVGGALLVGLVVIHTPSEDLRKLGEWVGLISSVLMWLAVLSVPAVFYTCAMTRYYDAMAPHLADARRPGRAFLGRRPGVRYR